MLKPKTVISFEQALSLPSATLRFAQLGWRVIKIESTPRGDGPAGDPNRYLGNNFCDEDRRAFYLAGAVGKEAMALNLATEEGRAVLHRMIRELDVDVFCCNTLPVRYEKLGIDYDTLKAIKPDIIWAGISAMGPDYGSVGGYDPILQAMGGIIDLTGEPDQTGSLAGIPLCDLKAGEEVYSGVCLALAERAESGQGKRIDVSMLQAISSWLINQVQLLNFDHEQNEVSRCGNRHPKFTPTSIFATKNGSVYMAVGSDLQWKRLVSLPAFSSLANDVRVKSAGRILESDAIYQEIGDICLNYSTEDLVAELLEAKIPCSPVNTVPQVCALDAIKPKLTTTESPDGTLLSLQPMAVDYEGASTHLHFPHKYAEDTVNILKELTYSDDEIATYLEQGVIAQDQELET